MAGSLARFHDRSSELGLALAMAALAAVATLSFVGTMSRYLFGAPIGWVPDWTGYLLATSVFAAAPAVTRRGEHVAMDLLASALPDGLAARALRALAAALTLAVLVAMAWIVGESLTSAFRASTATAAGYPIPRWWLLAFVLYGFGSSALHIARALGEALASRPVAGVALSRDAGPAVAGGNARAEEL